MSGISVGGNQFALESLDSLKAKRPAQQQPTQDLSGDSLQSLDSLMADRTTVPKGRIPANDDLLAPMDAISPEVSGPNKEDTRERGALGFGIGVAKGFGKAVGDTAMGIINLPKAVGGIVKSIPYAIHNPGKAAKAIAIDLPMGIVKGMAMPYVEAIGQGKYGEATGRAIFDVGLILMTAGMKEDKPTGGGSTPIAPAAGEVVAPVVAPVADVVTDVSNAGKTTRKASGVGGAGKVVTNSITGGVKIGKGALKELKEVVKVTGRGKIEGPVIINIGGVVNTGATTVNATTAAASAGKAGRGAKVAQQVSEVGAGVSAGVESVSAVTETVRGAGAIAIGFGEIKDAIGRGLGRIGNALRPVGTSINSGLDTVIGTGAANAVRTVAGSVSSGVKISVNVAKNTALFVKAHPVTSAVVAGKATDILTKGLQASDYYDALPDQNDQ